MDPITTSIVAAIATGVAGDTANPIVNAYNALKVSLAQKLGPAHPVVKAIAALETQPDSSQAREALRAGVAAAQADEDPTIMRAAMQLLDRLEEHPDGGQNIQKALNS